MGANLKGESNYYLNAIILNTNQWKTRRNLL